jgi:hypothetical protein
MERYGEDSGAMSSFTFNLGDGGAPVIPLDKGKHRFTVVFTVQDADLNVLLRAQDAIRLPCQIP